MTDIYEDDGLLDIFLSPIIRVILTSCPHILLKERIPVLEQCLEKEGYYGRFSIKKFPSTPHHDYIKIKVYLPNSKIEYSWPYGCFYDINKLQVSSKTPPFTAGLNQIMLLRLLTCLHYYYEMGNEYSYHHLLKFCEYWGFIRGFPLEKCLLFLFKEGLLTKEKSMIANSDAREFCENVFDPKNFMKI